MGTPLGPKYIPYTYMDPLGEAKEAVAGDRDVVEQFSQAVLVFWLRSF